MPTQLVQTTKLIIINMFKPENYISIKFKYIFKAKCFINTIRSYDG